MVMAMYTSVRQQYQFPVRGHNRFDLLVDGDVYFSAMLAAIETAQRFIFLEQYLVSSGGISLRFIQALGAAAQRGVDVYVMLDDFGSAGLSIKDKNRLTKSGVHICLYNPVRFKHLFHNLFRNHRKALIVDGRLAYTGGAGLADEFSAELCGALAWHDVMLEIHGPVVQDWCSLFIRTWQKHAETDIDLPPSPDKPAAGSQAGQLLSSVPLSRQEINRALVKQLRRCQQRAWITSPYFVAPRKIRRVLRQVARRGTDVRLLLPGQFSDHPWISYAARRHYGRMLRSGVRIFEYQPRFIHAKVELVDGWVSLGSSNLDRWNLYWNLDANQAIASTGFARQVEQLFRRDFADSIEVDLQAWQQRPLLGRFRETLSGWVIFWLERIIRFYR